MSHDLRHVTALQLYLIGRRPRLLFFPYLISNILIEIPDFLPIKSLAALQPKFVMDG